VALTKKVRKEVIDMTTTIYEYSLNDAVADGQLVEIFKKRWPELSAGKPIVVTRHLYREISLAALQEIWNQYVSEPSVK
jgi:hypothetical protein